IRGFKSALDTNRSCGFLTLSDIGETSRKIYRFPSLGTFVSKSKRYLDLKYFADISSPTRKFTLYFPDPNTVWKPFISLPEEELYIVISPFTLSEYSSTTSSEHFPNHVFKSNSSHFLHFTI